MILCVATGGTQILATFIAVYGFLMPPLGWEWAGFVWGYALIWALASDAVKVVAYRIFDPVKAVPAPKDQAHPKTGGKDEAEAKVLPHVTPELAH
jgi:H+-transporting ATPase